MDVLDQADHIFLAMQSGLCGCPGESLLAFPERLEIRAAQGYAAGIHPVVSILANNVRRADPTASIHTTT